MKCADLEYLLKIKNLEAKLEITKNIVSDIDKYVRDADLSIPQNKESLRNFLSELEMFLMSK
jgi:hypothetical protein